MNEYGNSEWSQNRIVSTTSKFNLYYNDIIFQCEIINDPKLRRNFVYFFPMHDTPAYIYDFTILW